MSTDTLKAAMGTATNQGSMVLLTRLAREVFQRSTEEILGMRLKEYMLLDTETFHTNGFDTFDTFVGWSAVAGLDHLHISVANRGDFVSIDNLSYGRAAAPVPEPTTIALVGMGLATIARRRWKARRAS